MNNTQTTRKKTSYLFGLIGYPLQHSLSPFLQEFLLKEIRQNGCYHSFEIEKEKLSDAVLGLKSLGFTGFNVTIPYKQTIMNYLDTVSEEARGIGAVNTVQIKKGILHGFNTDGTGFYFALKNRKIIVKGKTAVVIGAGGACRAVLLSLLRSGIKRIYLHNRTISRAQQVSDVLQKTTGFSNVHISGLEEIKISQSMASSQLCINTTPIGMWPKIEDIPYKFNFCVKDMTAIELIYNPLETKFLESARKAGANTVDGLDMFIYQGVEALKIWTVGKENIKFDFNKLRKYLIEKMQTYEQN